MTVCSNRRLEPAVAGWPILSVLVAAALVVAGCDDADVRSDPCDKDAYTQATLRNVHIEDLSGCDWLRACAPEQLSTVRAETKALREWARGLTDRCAREAYEGWAWFYDHEADRAEREMATHETRGMYDALDRRQENLDDLAREIAPTLPVPPR